MSLPHRRHHSRHAPAGRYARSYGHEWRDGLHQALHVQHVRTDAAASVLPDDGPLRIEPYVRGESGQLRYPSLLQDQLTGLAGDVHAGATGTATAAAAAAAAAGTTGAGVNVT